MRCCTKPTPSRNSIEPPALAAAIDGLLRRSLPEWQFGEVAAGGAAGGTLRGAAGGLATGGGGTATEYRLTGVEPARLTPQRAAAMDALQGEQASIRELAELVQEASPTRERHKHPATRTFQAIRIAVNHELDELRAVLDELVDGAGDAFRLMIDASSDIEATDLPVGASLLP